jgi:rhamnogalacturonyl hydrolase YesR
MKHKLIVIASALILFFYGGFAQTQKGVFTEDYITSTVEKACDWQLNNLFSEALLATGRIRPIPENGWIRGVFYTGVMAAYRVTEQERYLDSAYAWGINEGLLDIEQYLPVVKKAWKGLNEAMDESGKLGYVQQVGSSPASVTKDDSMEYGTAAYLLAAEEVLKLVRKGITI